MVVVGDVDDGVVVLGVVEVEVPGLTRSPLPTVGPGFVGSGSIGVTDDGAGGGDGDGMTALGSFGVVALGSLGAGAGAGVSGMTGGAWATGEASAGVVVPARRLASPDSAA